MEQSTFAELEHDTKKRRTRREVFLEKMDALIPWARLEARIEPFYPKAGRGRRPYPLAVMLRVHCVQLFYNVSDPGMEDLLYEVESVRRFVGLRLSGALPDETTILHFRHLLEKHGLGEALFEEINTHLASLGHRLKTGTIVDASIITAPSSTKNRTGKRDPQMHQTKKGNQWYFGMKAHIGVDADSGLAHSLETTPANTSDVATAHALLHGGEKRVWGDAGYQGVGKREENRAAAVDWEVAMKAGKRRQLDKSGPEEAAEKRKAFGAGEGGASVPVREAPLRLTRRCATGGWRRTRSASPCCSGSPTCSSLGATPSPDAGSIRPPPLQGGGMGRWGVEIPNFLTRKHNPDGLRRSTHAPDSSNARQNPSCSDLP